MPNELNLSEEQLEFLKKHRFYYCEESFPYVTGVIGRNTPEFYNKESIEQLIEEIKRFGKPLEDSSAIQFRNKEGEYYKVIRHNLQHIRKNASYIDKTCPIRLKNIIKEDEKVLVVVSRYTGDFGDGNQFIDSYYKNVEDAQKGLIPYLENLKKEHQEQLGYIEDILKEIK